MLIQRELCSQRRIEPYLLKQHAMIIKTGNESSSQAIQTTSRITRDPQVMEGKPCVRGMRVTMGMIVGQIRSARPIENVLEDFPYLEPEGVLEALQYSL